MCKSELISVTNPENRKIGFTDSSGRMVVPFVYDQIGVWSDGVIYVRRKKWYGFLNADAEEFLSLMEYEIKGLPLPSFKNGLCEVRKRDTVGQLNFGYINKSGEEVIPVTYSFCCQLAEGIFAIRETWKGLVSEQGVISDLSEYEIREQDICAGDKLIRIGKEGKYGLTYWGCCDGRGNIRVPIIYEAIDEIFSNSIIAKRNRKYLIVNTDGKELTSPSFDQLRDFHSGLCAAKSGKHWGFINNAGNVVLPIEYDEVTDFVNGFSYLKKNGKCGIANHKGIVILECAYDIIKFCAGGLCAVRCNNQWGYIDISQSRDCLFNSRVNVVLPIEYDELTDFVNGFSYLKKNGKCGIANHKGIIIVDCIYDEVKLFSGGLCAVRRNNKWGFVDTSGKLVIPLRFAEVKAFEKGTCEVKRNGLVLGSDNHWGIIDVKGDFVKPWDSNSVEIVLSRVWNCSIHFYALILALASLIAWIYSCQ